VVTVQRVVDASLPGGTCHPTILNWVASTSPNVAGYNIYRSEISGGPYTLLNSGLVAADTYTDRNVVSGLTYYYVIKSVTSAGAESSDSTQASATIPNP
jgi:fibronectin type 3 domain-containing protein